MRLRASAAGVWVSLLAAAAYCEVPTVASDEFDDSAAIAAVSSEAHVLECRKQIDALSARLLKLKARDFVALFGSAIRKPQGVYAMPVAQPRGIILSGIRYLDEKKNKDRVEFQAIGANAIEVYYSINGVSPSLVRFYSRVDNTFPRLTQHNLEERLAWDAARIKEMTAEIETRRAKVFVYEIDTEKEKELYAGVYRLDIKAKLDAWLLDGQQKNLRLDRPEDADGISRCWLWYRPDGTLAREARCGDAKDALPNDFRWHYEDGQSVCRTEYGPGQTFLTCWWWCRPGSSERFRCEFVKEGHERPGQWCWGGGEGTFNRQELDDNDDGIPDWFSEAGDGYAQHPLKPGDSWAVHPNLIPQAYQIPDQPGRCVPVRRIGSPVNNTMQGAQP